VGADPAWYVRKRTWGESIDASLAAKARGVTAPSAAGGNHRLFATKVLRGGQAPVKISVSIKGKKDIVLIAEEAADGNSCDHSVWADARFIDASGKVTNLAGLRPAAYAVGSGRPRNTNNDRRNPVIIGSEKFPRYIWAHAPSVLHFKTDGKYVRFEATVGVDQRQHKNAGSVVFVVSSDPKQAAKAAKRRGGRTDDTSIPPLWLALLRDFPAKQQEIMIVRDWLRRDKVDIADDSAKFQEPAGKVLELAGKTLAYVEKAAKQPTLAAELKALTARHAKARPSDWRDLYFATRSLRRRAILSHPALDFERILINRNSPPLYSHNGDQHLGRHSRVGKGLTILTDWKTTGIKATSILEGKLPPGSTRNPDLHYDAERIAFAFCDHSRQGQKRYFLYEAALDGSWVRQLTGTRRDKFQTWDGRATVIIEDNDPCYLPDDEIMFISTRCQSFGRCHGGRYNPAWNLHRCDKNGDKIVQVSFGNENEYEPSVLNDGRVVFTRWEYTNRHEMFFHMLWWCRPDGTNVSHFFGNDMLHPMMMVEATAIPGTHRVATTAQGHHSYNTGTTVILDTNKGENTEDAIEHITPETPYSESPGGGWPEPHYSHPYAINAELFLVSRANHRVHNQGRVPPAADRGIYLIDPVFGRELIYEDPEIASFSPIVIRKRKRPPVMPSMVLPDSPKEGTVFLQNAYLTRKANDPDGIIQPGMIKALRVIALGVQPRAHRTACSKFVPVEIPKKVIGTVPVDATGSAYFKAPSNVSLQVQTLDENGMAILTEKTLFYLQPGENRSCVGCHEPEGSSPVATAMAKLRRLTPMALEPSAGPQYRGGLSFMRTVQPVLDRYCISCHGLGQGKGAEGVKANKINLIHDGATWPRSFNALVALGDHRVGLKSYMGGSVNHNPADRNISKPRRFFAYRNKISHMLVKNHGNCNMDTDSYMRIIEWLDLNAQCYGDLFPNKLEERRIDANAMKALRGYATRLFGRKFAAQEDRALINVAQIDESRILMAPLAATAGGWGQIANGYRSKTDLKYVRMAALVNKCIIRKPNENTQGWEPKLEAGGGEKWVVEDRRKYIESIGAKVSVK